MGEQQEQEAELEETMFVPPEFLEGVPRKLKGHAGGGGGAANLYKNFTKPEMDIQSLECTPCPRILHGHLARQGHNHHPTAAPSFAELKYCEIDAEQKYLMSAEVSHQLSLVWPWASAAMGFTFLVSVLAAMRAWRVPFANVSMRPYTEMINVATRSVAALPDQPTDVRDRRLSATSLFAGP